MKSKSLKYLLPIVCCLLMACGSPQDASQSASDGTQLFTYVAAEASGVDFVNEVQDGEDFNVLAYRNFYNGGGVGIGDINNDGLDDLYFTANLGDNKLYLNKGDFQFEDITNSANVAGQKGWSTGVSMADVNADGFLDIYVSNSGDVAGDNKKNELFINQGDLTFVESAAIYGLDNGGYSTHASFFDYDKDGDLDCYILNNSFKDPSRIDIYSRTREENDALGGDKLMRNDGETFTDVTDEAGLFSSAIGFGLGVSVGDVNNDFWPDIYISNDFWERDYLYINNKDGSFSEELADRISICSVSSMGADIGDINNDGHLDIFTTDMLAADNYRLKAMTQFDPYHLEDIKFRSSYHFQILQNCLQVNKGRGDFQETASLSGVSATDWSWGALMFDFDNDGWQDIYVCNGIYHDIMYLDFANFIDDPENVKKIVTEKGRYDFRDFVEYLPTNPIDNYAFVNQKNLTFSNQAKQLGFKSGEFSNGAAYGDLDNDGDLDLVLNNVNMPASLYRNNNTNASIRIKLKDSQSKNPLGIGAKVRVKSGGSNYTQEQYMNRGFQSSVAPGLVFGLGDGSIADTIEVVWPDLTTQVLRDIPVDTIIEISKSGEKKLPLLANDRSGVAPFQDITSEILGSINHVEDIFNDFDRERLLPRMLSTEGPEVAVGDVNQDGRSDFLMLGPTGAADQLFIQSQSGKFEKREVPSFVMHESFESTCAAFFDSDGDGDEDLVIGSGGNDLSKGMDGFLMRYYENDGQGNFLNITHRTPPGGGQMSVIAPADFDGDGDMDLFVGGRSVPGNYGIVPRSFLFENREGKWVDIATKAIGTMGMVTDATWNDLNSDGQLDLLIVGDWMPITTLINGKDGFELRSLPNTNGWWLDIEEVDLNGDGSEEFVLGNWGLNSKFKASEEEPLKMYVKDFDKNGKSEFILNWYPPLEDKPYPFATKMDMSEQLPSLKKKFLKYEDFAQQDYESLFSPDERANAIEYTCHTLSSSVLSFDKGSFQLRPLPLPSQVAPAFAIEVVDYNHDGHDDIWIGGNFYGLKPEVGRLDASRGILLANNGNGGLEDVRLASDMVTGEVRDVRHIRVNDRDVLLVARNNLPVMAFSF